jgi:3-hydroxyacyl-[acyl-carrier-protein] dehydratase
MNDPSSRGATITARVHVPAQHPSLPGHFPGHPVVPGVVLLDHVAAALERAGVGSLRRILAVKFLTPLLPEQVAYLTAVRDGPRVRFRIERDGTAILSGDAETGTGNGGDRESGNE